MTSVVLSERHKRVIDGVLDELIREAVETTLQERLGPRPLRESVGSAPAPGAVDEAAGALCEAIAGVHARDLERAGSELPDRLVAELAGDLDEVLLEMVVEDTLRAEAAAHEASRRLLEGQFQRAFGARREDREAAVQAVVDAERERLARRERRRFASALSRLNCVLELEA